MPVINREKEKLPKKEFLLKLKEIAKEVRKELECLDDIKDKKIYLKFEGKHDLDYILTTNEEISNVNSLQNQDKFVEVSKSDKPEDIEHKLRAFKVIYEE